MSYEYNADSQRMDFPNPLYVENWFLAGTSALLTLGGLTLLIVSRGSMSHGHGMQSMLPLLIGLGLLVTGLRKGRRLFLQLRFFFGRGLPAGLAPELAPDAVGKTTHSDEIKETLRQNALTYPEPGGPLNGLLYAWIRELIFAPRPVQHIAQRQFQTGIVIVVTLVSFLIAWLGLSDRQASAWIGLFYFGFSVALLLRPLEAGAAAKADVGLRGLIVLVLMAIFGPVLLPMVSHALPDIGWLSLETQTLFLLLAALASVGMYFLALMNQMSGPPATNMAREQTSLSMNCHPKQLMDELDRTLQDDWVERIPNRRYARILPLVGGGVGTFQAELVEETQPLPAAEQRRLDIASAFRLPRFRWIAWLDVAGLSFTALATAWILVFGVRFDPATLEPRLFSLLTFGLAMLTLGSYCVRAGHVLWQRFDFTSRVVWIEMQGNYQSARMDVGNTFNDRVKTEKQVINIETMTLRVWAAELDSVIFGKDSARLVTGLRGLPVLARQLVDHLTAFAQEQSVIVAPTSKTDLQKAALLGSLNHPVAPAAGSLAATVGPAHVAAIAALGCPSCATPVGMGDRFCGNCGSAVST
ncbi:hypothetical protein [Luteibacter sp. CQ10]|uniref:hypothetical protein n=1 Tax=Luteibacter sp. CQ10 TaxID=2805821 RepID=UPI0034A4C663